METAENLSQETAPVEVDAQTEQAAPEPVGADAQTEQVAPEPVGAVQDEQAPAQEVPEVATTEQPKSEEPSEDGTDAPSEAACDSAEAPSEAPSASASAEAPMDATGTPADGAPKDPIPTADTKSAADTAQGDGTAATLLATEDVPAALPKMELARRAKEALIERAKELSGSTDWRKASDAQRALMEEWRKAGYAGKEFNDRLWDEFRAARDVFYKRREEHYGELRAEQAKVIEVKRQIIEEAKGLTADIRNWVATSDALEALMDRWKAAGNAGRENEQILWQEFNGIRRDFRARRKSDLAERRAKEHENADAKRRIVDEAKSIVDSGEYTRENSDRMRELNVEYKACGYAGKPANDTLWADFRAVQDAYWQANAERRDQRRREREERLKEAVERKAGQIEHLRDQNETLTTRLESTLNPEKVAQLKRWIAENEERLGGLADDIDEIKRKI